MKEGIHMKKRVMYVFIVAILGLSLFHATAKADTSTVSLQVDEKPFVVNGDVPAPYINHDGRTMVPLRFISESMGASVDWNGDTNQAMIQKGDSTIYVTVGLNQIVLNGKNVDMDTTAENTNGSVFVPARYIAEALGAEVDYNMDENKVYILSDKTNNFLAYGDIPKVKFPYTDTTDIGLQVTLNDIHVYKVDSPEAQEIINKYQLDINTRGNPKYFMWTHVTIQNNSNDLIERNGNSLLAKWKVGVDGIATDIAPSENSKIMGIHNRTDYLWAWELKPGESLSSYQAYFFNNIDGVYLDINKPHAIDLAVKG
jgi:hypothetical protein